MLSSSDFENNDSCLAYVTYAFNAKKYGLGASFGSLLMGAAIGWGIGSAVARYSSPCIDKPNRYAVDVCAMGSNQAMNGLGGGMAVLGGLTFFGAMVNAYDKGVAGRDELSFTQGMGDCCSLTSELCSRR